MKWAKGRVVGWEAWGLVAVEQATGAGAMAGVVAGVMGAGALEAMAALATVARAGWEGLGWGAVVGWVGVGWVGLEVMGRAARDCNRHNIRTTAASQHKCSILNAAVNAAALNSWHASDMLLLTAPESTCTD